MVLAGLVVREEELEGTAKTDKEDGRRGRGAKPEPGSGGCGETGEGEGAGRRRAIPLRPADPGRPPDAQDTGLKRCGEGGAHGGRSVDSHPGNQDIF